RAPTARTILVGAVRQVHHDTANATTTRAITAAPGSPARASATATTTPGTAPTRAAIHSARSRLWRTRAPSPAAGPPAAGSPDAGPVVPTAGADRSRDPLMVRGPNAWSEQCRAAQS